MLKALVCNVGEPEKSVWGDVYYRLCLRTHDNVFYVNAWDNASVKCKDLKRGDYIEAQAEGWYSVTKENKIKYNFKIVDLRKISKTEDLGLFAEGHGVIGTLDVHEAAGKSKQLISVDPQTTLSVMDKAGVKVTKKALKSYLTLNQNSLFLKNLNPKDSIIFCGLLDPSKTDRLMFKKIFNIKKERNEKITI